MSQVTWKLIPFLWVCFMAAFMDRVNVGFAKKQMVLNLGISDTVYGLGAGIFFIGYFLFEVPSNLILDKVGARIWIARIMVMWGFVSAGMAFVQGPVSFYILRFLLGATEAGFFPGVILYLTFWFPSAYRSRTVAKFMTAAVTSTVIGTPLSKWLLAMDGMGGLSGWKWLFIIEALPSIILGVVVFFRLPTKPAEAKWLSPESRDWLVTRLASEGKTAVGTHDFSFLQTAADPRVLLLCLVYFLNVVGGYGLDFFLPTLVSQVKVSDYFVAVPALLTIPAMLLVGRSSDSRGERRWHVALALWLAAFGLMLSSLPLAASIGIGALVFAVAGRWCTIAPFWGLATESLRGRNAAGGIAMINAVGNLGGFCGPFLMGWLKTATGDYTTGLRLLSGAMLVGGLLALVVRVKKQHDTQPSGAAVETSSLA